MSNLHDHHGMLVVLFRGLVHMTMPHADSGLIVLVLWAAVPTERFVAPAQVTLDEFIDGIMRCKGQAL